MVRRLISGETRGGYTAREDRPIYFPPYPLPRVPLFANARASRRNRACIPDALSLTLRRENASARSARTRGSYRGSIESREPADTGRSLKGLRRLLKFNSKREQGSCGRSFYRRAPLAGRSREKERAEPVHRDGGDGKGADRKDFFGRQKTRTIKRKETRISIH